MEKMIPWQEWVALIEPYYPAGKRGRPPIGNERMLRLHLLGDKNQESSVLHEILVRMPWSKNYFLDFQNYNSD